MPKAEKRITYELRKSKETGHWYLRCGGGIVPLVGRGRRQDITLTFGTERRWAVFYAAELLDQIAERIGQHSELQVIRRDGTIGERRTFPRKSDPRETKG